MSTYELKNKRFVCWDEFLIDKKENASVIMHKPEKKNIAFTGDAEWEGNVNGYPCVFKDGDTFRLYYRSAYQRLFEDGSFTSTPTTFCLAESKDGKTFRRPNLGQYEFVSTKNTNIVHMNGKYIDNFTIIKDTNPNCKKEEAYKAISPYNFGNDKPTLGLFVSEDGYKFTLKQPLDLHGAFDSYNVFFWDEKIDAYRFYYRGNHEGDHREHDTSAVVGDARTDVRDVRLAITKDFNTFDVKGILDYTKEDDDWLELYTNQISRYYRADDVFLGIPTRYIDRRNDKHSFEHMPLGDRHAFMTYHHDREGTAVTDCVLMTSRDGFTFERWGEAFLTPGIEARNNWWYGDCYTAYGLIETESDTEGAPNEISFFVGEDYRIRNVSFRRYTIRLDGFFSWNAPHAGGSVLTKPVTFTGDELEVNFSTSAFGGLTITICDEAGTPIEGYTSKNHFGDSVDRKVPFEKSLKDLNGKTVRLLFTMKDCDLYSFKFN